MCLRTCVEAAAYHHCECLEISSSFSSFGFVQDLSSGASRRSVKEQAQCVAKCEYPLDCVLGDCGHSCGLVLRTYENQPTHKHFSGFERPIYVTLVGFYAYMPIFVLTLSVWFSAVWMRCLFFR